MVAENIVVETPEQVGLDFEIAGVGTRFIAAVLDGLCMSLLLLAATIVPFFVLSAGDQAADRMADNMATGRGIFDEVNRVVEAVILLAAFVVIWGYYIIAEMVTDGRSPGKRAVGLRVVREDGLPIALPHSVIRNVVRVIDFLPGVYGVGLIAIMATERTQRLGDLAAGTLVVKDRAGRKLGAMPQPEKAPPAAAVLPAALSAAEREVIDRFIARRGELSDEARARLAHALAAPLRARLGDHGQSDDEEFLIVISTAAGGPA